MSILKGVGHQTAQVIAFAESLGFVAELTRGGHVRLSKPGRKKVFVSKTPSCPRALKNAMADVRKAEAGTLYSGVAEAR